MDAPVIFEEERLEGGDFIRVTVVTEEEEVGRVEFLLRDLFQKTLEGDVEVWLKITETRPSPLTSDRQSDDSTRFGRMRIEVNLREVAKKEELTREKPRKVLSLPEGLAHCSRCEYMEKLTVAQQNELQSEG